MLYFIPSLPTKGIFLNDPYDVCWTESLISNSLEERPESESLTESSLSFAATIVVSWFRLGIFCYNSSMKFPVFTCLVKESEILSPNSILRRDMRVMISSLPLSRSNYAINAPFLIGYISTCFVNIAGCLFKWINKYEFMPANTWNTNLFLIRN